MRVREPIGGVAFLATLSGTVALSLWISQSNLDAVVTGDRLGYTLCLAGPAALLADFVGTALGLLVLNAIVARCVRGRLPVCVPSYRELRYLRPFFFVATNVLGLTVVWFANTRWWPPLAYVAVDLHPWLWLAASALVVVEINQASAGALGRRIRAVSGPLTQGQLLLADLAVVVIAVTLVTICSAAAFSSVVVGDEPKYLRFCESWWQGLGVEVTNVRDVSTLSPADISHFTRTLTMIGPAMRADLVNLGADVRYLGTWRHWRHRFNKARDVGSAFIQGKDGGLYQIHTPGIAAIILPAYFIDRAWFDTGKAKFPDDLFTVNLTFLAMFAVLAAAVFRLALTYGTTPSNAIALALAITLSLPVGAFPFQFYPEMLGAVIVCVVFRHLLGRAPLRYPSAAGLGFGLGLLGWLHVRFDLLALVGVGWMMWMHRRERAALAITLTVFAVFSGMLGLYTYHVTGSVLPWALYPPTGGPPQFEWNIVPRGMLSLAFDRNYGLLPLNPMFLLAVPGVALMCRHNRRAVILLITFVTALVLPTSGHRLNVAGTTPLRFVLAVVPLGALPLAEWLAIARRRPLGAVLSMGLVALSVSNCLAHDLANDDKTATLMVASGFSGWNPSLLFPQVYYQGWMRSGYDPTVLVLWIGVIVALIVWGLGMPREGRESAPLSPSRAERLAAGFLAAVAAFGVLGIVAGGPRRARQFLPGALHADVVGQPDAGTHCRVTLSVPAVPLSPASR